MSEHNSAYLAWQDPSSREWHVVGLLQEASDGYIFKYTHGASASEKFIPFSGMDDLRKTYISQELFPLFKNRLLSNRRPEYPKFIQWLGLSDQEANPIDILGRSGAIKNTDQLQMFKRLEIENDGHFKHCFFAHGLSHLSASANTRTLSLSIGERLFLCPDPQNSFDNNAVLIRAENPAEIVGYCPRYISKDVTELLSNKNSVVEIFVESLSEEAPANYKLLCKLVGKVDLQLVPDFMNRPEFSPITNS